ncbi:unnamed protein product [Rotaria magnacalcarata]|uniref:MYND-type domain-containing protein n=1 Tax=Rotaria magnacalcarata TaxID=392030 RepID=A0A815EZ39_9BILA|nr:unnamed protein product [Rotaria magnacalcarata]CAF1321313.1 unnamed protein product [Rotaria magnacalcarata]CAF2031541.1 unnamed protein product [Rotaria magnacalcarata]CAF3847230.1 unnamed protein product [Rotaria magnacalcarata]CAF4002694.1 unnamed protein product [Rotaria magnacalcarata]
MANISSDVRNYFKLELLSTRSYGPLRQLFKNRYSQFNGGQIWNDTPTCGTTYLTNVIKKNKKISLTKVQNVSVSNGDSNEWDLTTITALLIYGDRPKTLNAAEVQQLDEENKLLEQLREIRNKLVHHASKSVATVEFNQLWTDLATILVALGDTDTELDKLKDDSIFEAPTQVINEDNVKEASRLNTLATQAHKDGKFFDAIALFTKATVLPGVLEHDRAIFYSDMSSSRLALYEKQQKGASSNFEINDREDQRYLALRDAKQARNLWLTWWKGHFHVGKVYAAINEHDKAVNSFERALALEPTKNEIQKELDDSRHIFGRQMRYEYLDPQYSPKTVSEHFNAIHETLGIDPENLQTLHSLVDQLGLDVADVLKGHKYEHGDIDIKQDYEQAAKYYAKAARHGSAAGMYYLARLTDLGLGVKKDHDMAHKLFEQAAEQSAEHPKFKDRPNVGVADAENALGLHYAEGVGVHKHAATAVYWYQRAVDHGNAEAANSLALMYQRGNGVEKNLDKAEQLFELSARRRDSNAMLNLAELLLDKNDFEMAQRWFDRACKSGNILAQTNRTNFEKTLRDKKQLLDGSSPSALPMINTIKKTFDSLKLSTSISELSNKSSKYDYNALSEYANRGSITAKRLCNALEYFLSVLEILTHPGTLTEQQEDSLVHELSECYRLEHIVAQFPIIEMQQNVGQIVDRALRRCREVPDYPASQLDEDARVCYGSLRMDSKELIDQFLNSCRQKYPKSIYFFEMSTSINGWLEKYDTVVYNANAGLELDPNNSNLLIDKAVAWRQLEHYSEAIEAYKTFLTVAPRDHRKVPDAYYSMAICYLTLKRDDDLDVAKKMYEQGEEAEKLQLPCFLPYESNGKNLLKLVFNIPNLINTKAAPKAATPVVDHKSRLTDPNRIEIIKRHRKWQVDIIEHRKKSQVSIPFYNKPRLQQQTAKSLVGLKAISLREMDPTKDHVYQGYVLSVTIIEEAYTWIPSIHIVIEDEHHQCEQMFIFNFPDGQGEHLTSKVYTNGAKMHIINPYHRLGANDAKPLIRVDDFSSIIMQNESDRVINMCRCCGEPNAVHVCSGCKKARYCSKECQTMDWKLYDHKIICKKQ